MALATLSIDLVAKLAQFEKDMGSAARVAEKHAQAIASSISKVKETIAALAGAAVVGGMVALVRVQVDAIDKFNDLKDATGASIENISGLDRLARDTGVHFEDMASTLVKFNKALGEAKDDNGAGQVFKALGLDVERLKQLDPVEALQQTAIAMQGFARDGNLARATQELFGKSIQQAAPLLKDLAEAGNLNTKITTEQAEAAERLNKQLFAMQANSDDLKRELVSGLIPAMSKLLENYRAIKDLGSLDLILKDAARGLIPGMTPRLAGDPGENINKMLAERTELERQSALAATEGRNHHVKTLNEEIAAINRYLEVARAKQRTDILLGLSGDTSDAMSRRMNPSTKTLRLPRPGGGPAKVDPMIDQGRKLADSLFGQDAHLSPDFFEKWNKLSAAYKGNAISLDMLTEAQAILLKQQPFMKQELFGDNVSDAMTRRMEALERERKGLEDLNAEIDKFSDNGDTRKRQLTAALEARLNAGEIFSPEQLDRVVRGIGGVNEELKKTVDIAGDFATVFESGFEKAILSGEKLSEVLKGLGRDILQIALRTAITQPLGKAAGGWLAGVFSGILPSFDVGTDYVPHDMVAKIHKGEKIVPAAQNRGGGASGITVVISNTIGSIASKSDVVDGMRVVRAQIMGQLSRSRGYGGVA